jgi:hippurate hydrolase
MKIILSITTACYLLTSSPLLALTINKVGSLEDNIDRAMPALSALYLKLHQAPELSLQEKQTSKVIAGQLKALGFDTTENIGGYGVVGLYKNGQGPTVMIRTDTDGLPIVEQTGKTYASKVTTLDNNNNQVGVMHGCGHDIHMTSFIGTAEQLMQMKQQWQGTLMMVAQPAEEVGAGAKAMLKAGLFERFAKPDHILGLHVSAALPAGKIGIAPGYALANVDSVDITVKGKGGHGAYPHTTVDPVVISARIIMALQTIASREVSPLEPSVITVGSIHGGAKHNIISDQVTLQLTLRSYNQAVRTQQIAAIKRITKGIAMSAGLSEAFYPSVTIQDENTPSTYNNPELAKQVKQSIVKELGENNVQVSQPVMAGEDFGRYGLTADKLPITIFWLGAVAKEDYEQSIQQKKTLPSLHSSQFAPDYPLTIKTGVRAMTASALDLFAKQ